MFSRMSSRESGADERRPQVVHDEGTPPRPETGRTGDGPQVSRRSVATSVAVLALAPVGAGLRLPSAAAAPSGPVDDGGQGKLPTNEELARLFFDELHTAGDLDIADTIVAPDAVIHTPSGDLEGPEGIRGLVTLFRTAFPDAAFPMEDVVSAGDHVIVRWSMSGTSRGDFQGVPRPGSR